MLFWNSGRIVAPLALTVALSGGLLVSAAPVSAAGSMGGAASSGGAAAEAPVARKAKETPAQKASRLAKHCLVKGKVTRGEIACIARSQVGMKEWGNNCNPYGKCLPWCGIFARWVMVKAGGTAPSGYPAAAAWRKWKKIKTPKVGDVAVRSDGQHVEVVVKVYKKSGKTVVASVGGNSGNKVTYHSDNRYARWTYHRNPKL